MKLLLLDQFSDPGGAQQCLLDLLPAIRERGWHARVGLPGAGELFDRVAALGFDTQRIACGPYASGRKSPRDLARFVRDLPRLYSQMAAMAARTDADLVYLNGPRLLPAAALAPLRLPVLFHSHSYLAPGPARWIAGAALRRLDASVVGCCEFVAAPWRKFIPADRVRVIYNSAGPGFPVASAPRRAPLADAAPVVACIGRIAPEKGQLDFLAAAREIHRAVPACRFRIIGAALFTEARADRYRQQVQAAAAGLPVEFTGWLPDIGTELPEIDVLLVPSAPHEATTRVIPEAFAAGVPVIAYRSGGIPEVVEDGRTGFLVDNAAGMARRTIQLLQDPAGRAELARAARDSCQRRFTPDRYRREMLEVIERAAGGRG